MKNKRFFANSLAFIGLACLSGVVSAGTLTIFNHTNEYSTTFVLGNGCSKDILKNGRGVTPPQSSPDAPGKQTVPEGQLRIACRTQSPSHCVAQVFMTPDCSGPVVATAIIDIVNGVQDITPEPTNGTYRFEKDGFVVNIYYN